MKNKIITIFAIMILLICFIIPASSTRTNFSNEIRISRLSNESTEFSNLNLELGDIVWRWVDARYFPVIPIFYASFDGY